MFESNASLLNQTCQLPLHLRLPVAMGGLTNQQLSLCAVATVARDVVASSSVGKVTLNGDTVTLNKLEYAGFEQFYSLQAIRTAITEFQLLKEDRHWKRRSEEYLHVEVDSHTPGSLNTMVQLQHQHRLCCYRDQHHGCPCRVGDPSRDKGTPYPGVSLLLHWFTPKLSSI